MPEARQISRLLAAATLANRPKFIRGFPLIKAPAERKVRSDPGGGLDEMTKCRKQLEIDGNWDKTSPSISKYKSRDRRRALIRSGSHLRTRFQKGPVRRWKLFD